MEQVLHPARLALVSSAQGWQGWRPRPQARRPRIEQARLRLALAYIDGHLDGELGPAALARHCGLSARRLLRAFSAAVGVPLHRYVAHKRLERARERLLAGKLVLFERAAAASPAPFASQAELAAAAVRAASAGIDPCDEAGG